METPLGKDIKNTVKCDETPQQTNRRSKTSEADIKQNENQENHKFEDEKAYKAWKKSIMMVLSNISSHKFEK